MLRRFFGNRVSIPAGAAGPAAGPLSAVNLAAVHDPALSMHEPPLEPRDEAIFLLTAAAEIEHALMTQYLFADYSLRVVSYEPHFEQLDEVQRLLLQIAREEMGHLATVQNLLHLIGDPLNFNREHSPYASDIYPFRFKLEPLTRQRSGRPGIMRERNPTPEPVGSVEPPPQTLSFEADIKNLFRAVPDVSVMKNISGFDLHKFEDVRDNAERIFDRIADGTMPCDGAWPPDRLAIFRKWIDDGMNP